MTGLCNNGSSHIKEHFRTTEGTYKLLHTASFYQPLSHVKYPKLPLPKITLFTLKDHSGSKEKIIFNITRELFLLNASDLHQLDGDKSVQGRHTFKDKCPTCHDVNLLTRSKDSINLLVGTTDGQVHHINPLKWDLVNIYNEHYMIESNDTSVTGVKWIPGSETQFMVSYSSGNMYLFNTAYYFKPSLSDFAVNFTLAKQGDSYNILVHRSKSRAKEITKWELRCGVIHEFSFSPDCKHLAVVSQDGFLRIFDFNSQDLVSAMRSYFGGLLCVCWSPDGRYIVTGGEDDLVTVWSLQDHKVTARGEGHRSWVTMVTFDPYTSKGLASNGRPLDSENAELPVYRFGSVGQDAHIFFWDLCEDSLEPVTPWKKEKSEKTKESNVSSSSSSKYSSHTLPVKGSSSKKMSSKVSDSNVPSSATLPHRNNKLSKLRSFVRYSQSEMHLSDAQLLRNIHCYTILDSVKVPRLYEVPRIDPLVSKRVSSERLTCLVFTKDHVIIACTEGFIYVWSRPPVATSHAVMYGECAEKPFS